MKVRIPFWKRFKEPMLSGEKTWTSRTKRYGKVDDTFDAFGETFKILKVECQPLIYVACHWKEEGCESFEDFVDLWRQIHPRKGYVPSWLVWLHVFKKVEGVGDA